MSHHINISSDGFFVSYDPDEDFVSVGPVRAGDEVSSGKPVIEFFQTEAEVEARVDSIMGTGHYQTIKVPDYVEQVHRPEPDNLP
jgi:hypothetical protein